MHNYGFAANEMTRSKRTRRKTGRVRASAKIRKERNDARDRRNLTT